MSDYIRVFRTPGEYEAFKQAEAQALKQRHIDEALARRARDEQRRRTARWAPVTITKPFEERCREVQRILKREDVREAEQQATRFARLVRVFSGGAPSLGHR